MIQPLTKAFRELRTLGYLAERRFADCRSCAMAKIVEPYDNLFVYTTTQSDNKKDNVVYIMWSAPDDNPSEIIKVLRKYGLRVKKPKNASFAIQVLKDNI